MEGTAMTDNNTFKDVLLDDVPYEEMRYQTLLDLEAQGDEKAVAEIARRTKENLPRMV
jgi:hypothetical protein